MKRNVLLRLVLAAVIVEHTDDVLRELLHLGDADLAALRAEGVLD